MIWACLLALTVLTTASIRARQEFLTPTSAFSALWILGSVFVVVLSGDDIGFEAAALIIGAAGLLFLGEQLVPQAGSESGGRPELRRAARWYWLLTAIGMIGAAWKLRVSYAFAGDLESMVTSTALRGAITSADLPFPSLATALASCMYLAAAVSGFLCQDRPRPRHFVHFVPALLDSVAIAGRGSFLIVSLITLVGCALTWQGSVRGAALRIGSAALGVLVLVGVLSLAIGRTSTLLENAWEYTVAPLYGLREYLSIRPPPSEGLTIVNGLTSKLGASQYDAGEFVWATSFTSNVSSGFQELMHDFGAWGILLFLPFALVAAYSHRQAQIMGRWAPYAIAVSLYSFLGYFYFVSLSAFLPGWWLLLASGIGTGLYQSIQRRVMNAAASAPESEASAPGASTDAAQ